MSEDAIAEMLGEPLVRDLRSFAGLRGDYTPGRRFGTTGEHLVENIRAHNQGVARDVDAHVREWTDP